MVSCRALWVLALLGLAIAVCSVSAAPHPNLRLRQRNGATGMGAQESPKYSLDDLLLQLAQPERDVLEYDEQGEARLEQERSQEFENDPSKGLPPRERKAGCRNFYWKTFTSC
ncbi:somatostatin-1-like [Acipenser oxyrinchus oxyrinchus]|uniref:Somatostatin-1-like n=1 Tax=Acipenser oxyrinchus oxyrinchus TaxID=40147 RepID=A0AAD8DE14_ACIOX|nr:somatostatin-1-like [Acipenser oxyrinchus oxyrinchus]